MLTDYFTGKGINFPPQPTELRTQRNTTRNVNLLSGNLVSNSKQVAAGVSARVYDHGVYGFASIADFSPESINLVLKDAADNASFLGSKAGTELGVLPPLAPGSNFPLVIEPEFSQKIMIDFLKELDAHLKATYPGLAGRSVSANCLDMEKFLYASNGGATPIITSHSMVPRAIVRVSLTVRDPAGAPINLGRVYGGFGFFPDHFADPSQLYEDINDLYERAMKKREGVHASAGTHLVIMGPDLAGILAHEAVGHTVESDVVLGGSVAAQLMNQKVASELVTLVDFAHTVNGELAPVPVYVDDDGIIAKDIVLIEQGILKAYMHDRASAKRMGYEPHGNARAFAYYDEPLVRMRNTAILSGTSKLADMIASVEDGYYLVRSSNGQADATGEFMFGIAEGYEIKGGKIARAIRDTTISGVAFEMLKSVDMVSDDMVWSCSGMCGKKQSIPVGMGGAAVRCYINIGGR
ncbi:MAG: TldD/PmbA family protein [Symbiobacteriaceae bacterium]|nr:TldD/PmbA family protein [Symbiobacteriaceae bacterium]